LERHVCIEIGENSLQHELRIDFGMKSIGDGLGGMALSNLNISSDVTGAKSEKNLEGSISMESRGPETGNKLGLSRTRGTMLASFVATSSAMPDNLLMKNCVNDSAKGISSTLLLYEVLTRV